jgi:hypothetical protein
MMQQARARLAKTLFDSPFNDILAFILAGLFVCAAGIALTRGTIVASALRLLFLGYAGGLIVARLAWSLLSAPSRIRVHRRTHPSRRVSIVEWVSVALPGPWSLLILAALLTRGAFSPKTLFAGSEQGTPFSGHRRSTYTGLFIVFLISSILELPILGLLANSAGLPSSLHYVLLALGIASIWLVVGDIRCVQHLPVRVCDSTLVIECGGRAALQVAHKDVLTVTALDPALAISNASVLARSWDELGLDWKQTLIATPLGACNVSIKFTRPVFSMRHGRSFTAALLRLDEPAAFLERVSRDAERMPPA